ncbi:MAG: hypothetical protein Ct9H300mP1_11320 [Planctomycetaceae bacterium]|nr:MAG: hypothetical protein Ct9H300mP1_11320 [Planctomycetaceae bacterium]
MPCWGLAGFPVLPSSLLGTEDADAKLATFCPGPAIRTKPTNFFCEVLATAVLVLAVLMQFRWNLPK